VTEKGRQFELKNIKNSSAAIYQKDTLVERLTSKNA